MNDSEKYIVTGNNFPDWFVDGTKRGVLRVVKDEDGVFLHIIVESPSGRKIANKDDVILKTKSGYSVITGEQAKKYRVSFVPKSQKKVEEKEDEVKE